MGEVFLGHDPRLQRRVALKRLTADAVAGDRILREARAAARLNHPNIAAVYDVIQQDDQSFIVMEDRKSTRLNSSHSQISYAVFCLKKKKNKQTRYELS